YAKLLCLNIVHLHFKLGIICSESSKRYSYFRPFHQFAYKAVTHITEFIQWASCTILQYKIQSVYITESRYGWEGKHEETGPFNSRQLTANLIHNGIDIFYLAALFKRFQVKEQGTKRWA